MHSLPRFFLLVFSLAASSKAFYWSEIVPNSSSTIKPPARAYAGLAWTATDLYLFGGKAETGALSKQRTTVCIHEPDVMQRVFIYDHGFLSLGDTWYYSFFMQSWTPVSSLQDKPSARYGFISGQIGDYWYITHGKIYIDILLLMFCVYLQVILKLMVYLMTLGLFTLHQSPGAE